MTSIASWLVRPSWLHWPHLPTWDTVAYHLGVGGLTWFGFYSAIEPWVALIGIGGAVVCFALAWVASITLPSWLSWFGPIGTALSKAKYALQIAAWVLGVTGLIAAGFWFASLLSYEARYKALNSNVLNLEESLGCLARENASERDLFACVPAQQRDAEAARAVAIEAQRQESLTETGALNDQLDAVTSEVTDLQTWREQHKSEDGPLPQNLIDYYRQIGGAK